MEHSRFGYSATSDFEQCPYKYKLRWIDELETLSDFDPTDPLILGTALHKGAETDLDEAIVEYYMTYPVIGDKHVEEAMKLTHWIKKVKAIIDTDTDNPILHETKVKVGKFVGTIDLLEEVGTTADGKKIFNMYDFKYANPKGFERYKESRQLHLYKYMYEQATGNKIATMAYILVPKTAIRQKQTEDLYQFNQRLKETLESMDVVIMEIEFNQEKVDDYYDLSDKIRKKTEFEKKPSNLCDWCEYQKYCEKGIEFMNLPKNQRRKVGEARKRTIWLYGAPFSGKTTVLDGAPDPLNLNTDGNIKFVTMQFLKIADKIEVKGRLTERTFAWETFKETIEELEKKQNDFKTIIVDLVDDTREMCRVYMYDKLNIQHESDSGYGKGWDIIKTEYLSTMRRFFNLDYDNLVIVSHEVVSEVKFKNGQTVTKISPNIQDAIANKLAGMVDIVARVVVEDDGSRTLNFKADEFVFGGGRLKGITKTTIPLSWEALTDVYDAIGTDAPKTDEIATKKGRKVKGKEEPLEEKDAPEGESDVPEEEAEVIEEPKKTRRSSKKKVEPEGIDEPEEEVQGDYDYDQDEPEDEVIEEPKTRTRKKSTVEPKIIDKVPESEEKDPESDEKVPETVKKRTRRVRS